MFPWRKCGGQPLVVEACWSVKKARINDCRKKGSLGERVHTEPDMDVVVQDEPELDDVVVQDEPDLDDVVVQNEPNLDDVGVQNENIRMRCTMSKIWIWGQNEENVVQIGTEVATVDVQTGPILEVLLQIEVVVVDVVQTKPHLDVVVPSKAALDGPVKKTRSLSELDIVPVIGSTNANKKKKKLSGKKK